MKLKSINPNFDSGPNIGGWSIIEIVYTIKVKWIYPLFPTYVLMPHHKYFQSHHQE